MTAESLPLRPPIVVHHMNALDGSPYPPNSLEGIRACLEANAPFIEIDASALYADDFLLVHDATLESETSGRGEVASLSPDQARALFIKQRGAITSYRPPLLGDVVALMTEYGGASRLQIDLKDILPMDDDEPLRRLVRIIEPLGQRVIVSTYADWHLRHLHKMADWLDLGLDPGLYLDHGTEGRSPSDPPLRLGAYGYYDDHLLALHKVLPPAKYLAERCEVLRTGIPEASIWYVSYRMITQALNDGFNMADWLHGHGIKLDAWTMDADRPGAAALVPTLRDAGVDQFTTNTPIALAKLIAS